MPPHMPMKSFDHVVFDHVATDELADPSYNTAGPIDGIIGVTLLARHLRPRVRQGPHGLMAQDTTFGWIIFGGQNPSDSVDLLATIGVVTVADVYKLIQQFWHIDDSHDDQIVLSPDDIACEQLYQSTLVKPNKRYAVTIMLKPDAALGQSRGSALRRLYSLEKRFQREPGLQDKYIEFMRQYHDLGHMIEAKPLQDDVKMHYYIPHHGVAIERKFRVVFDASANTSNGQSLNDIVYTGARLQKDIVDILMNFRVGQIALTADIIKMYRQVQMQPRHWDLQRILWRESTTEPVKEFALTTVTYGVASAPFCAIRTLVQCADDNTAEFPRAARVAKNDFYVDDLLTSTHTRDEAAQLRCDLTTMLGNGGFELSKWQSNCSELVSEHDDIKLVSDQDSTSVLGIIWNHHADEFRFKVHTRIQPATLTKRIVTSEAARIFDPSGFVTPITIKAKLFIRTLWCKGEKRQPIYAWDDPLPSSLADAWRQYYSEIQDIAQIRIPRWLGIGPESKLQLHVFCDASAQAYAAVAYLRVFNGTKWSANLLCSKTRVAPVDATEQTIPRLELCSLVLACSLVKTITKNEAFAQAVVHVWNDSEVALYWLRKPTHQLKTFVANRVSQILKVVAVEQTRHIPTDQNPADLPSRDRTTVAKLVHNELWWHGPQMLGQANDDWPEWNPRSSNASAVADIASKEEKQPIHFPFVLLNTTATDGSEIELTKRLLSHQAICRVTGWVMRFCHLAYRPLRAKRAPKSFWLTAYGQQSWSIDITATISDERLTANIEVPRISAAEFRIALHYWLRLSQQESFPDEIHAIEKKQTVSRQSQLWTLTPQMSNDGLLRIYGRLGNSSLPDSVKHPIILHRKSRIADALAREAHAALCHGGVQSCTQLLRRQYWIIGVRVLLRSIIYKCDTCTRYRQENENQFMADLPTCRLEIAPAFELTGIDMAGPITLKLTRNTTTKAWIAVFVCMRFKAIHLELVGGMDAESLIAALTRFINLRAGCVRHMYSDNGTNFVGAARDLQEAAESWQHQSVGKYLSDNFIEWHFNTPYAPHHGGQWESMVKIVKTHLRKMAGAHLFNFEEMTTLLAKISACVNSRPLTPVSTDPSDLTALTPSHFIASRPITTPLEADVVDTPMNRLSAWQRITKLQQEFWNRWSAEYLTELQKRNKWAIECRSVKVGDFVIIKEDKTPPSRWLTGRVVDVFPGPDGLVRSCRVKTKAGTYDRPVTKLCPLPIANESE